MKAPNKQALLDYQNQDVVDRFIKIYGVSDEQAQQIFTDVKLWLWMACKARVEGISKPLVIDTALVVIDEMWHNFMLFTRDYTAFCERFFGTYMHHSPNTKPNIAAEKAQMQHLSLKQKKQQLMDRKRWQYEFVYDQLGRGTFIRWYKVYPGLYTPLSLAQMAIKSEQQRVDDKQAQVRAAVVNVA